MKASKKLFLNAAQMLYSGTMNTLSPPALEVWHDVQQALGGESYRISGAEINQVIIVEDAPSPYVIKIPYNEKVAEQACLSELEMCRLMADVSETTDLSFPIALGDWRSFAGAPGRRSVGLEAGVLAYEEKSGQEVSRELLEHCLLERWVASCSYCVINEREVPGWVMSMARDIGSRPDLEEIKGYNASLQKP